jgi:WD40 repeat protein
MRQFNTPAGEVHALRFTPDGESIYLLSKTPLGDLLGSFYQHGYRIDSRSGEVTGNWSLSGSEVAIFTPDSRSIYHSVSVAVAGGELDLWRLDLVTDERERVYEANVPYPHHLAFTPNGHILAIAGWYYAGDGRYSVHRLDVWHRTELDPIPFEASCLAYAPNGRYLATGGANGVRVWLGKSLSAQWTEPAAELAWSQDGVLAWGNSNRLAVAHPDSEEPVRVWTAINDPLCALTFSPDGRLLLAGTYHGRCVFHDPLAGEQRTVFDWGIGKIHSVEFAPDGLTCAAGGEKGQVVIWDVDT